MALTLLNKLKIYQVYVYQNYMLNFKLNLIVGNRIQPFHLKQLIKTTPTPLTTICVRFQNIFFQKRAKTFKRWVKVVFIDIFLPKYLFEIHEFAFNGHIFNVSAQPTCIQVGGKFELKLKYNNNLKYIRTEINLIHGINIWIQWTRFALCFF